jgi:transcriptional regulator with XRE-family HTH domain
MAELTQKIGQKIRSFRKKRHMTVQILADAICKSKATVSKYESGQIVIDIITLYDIARVLKVNVSQLLCSEQTVIQESLSEKVPSFFKGMSQCYMYYFDGRNNTLIRCVIDILEKVENNIYKTMLYMNIKNYEEYQYCENTYAGYMKHFDAITNLTMQNLDTPMEQYIINILASYLDAPTKWALVCGISSRPLMPIATKNLISKSPLSETEDLNKKLRISKEDIRLLKLYNMLAVT